MDYSYSIVILALPLFMFLTLALGGNKMSQKFAGILGTLGLMTIAVLSYMVAFQYFGMDRVDGIRPALTPYNFEWLSFTEKLTINLGVLLDPISVMILW